jgi:hypothetical protein
MARGDVNIVILIADNLSTVPRAPRGCKEARTDISVIALKGSMLARIWAKVFSQGHVAPAQCRRFNPCTAREESRAASAGTGAKRGFPGRVRNHAAIGGS